jgi:uncharacterized glyoxalase superfamily metalloenzyme YdcJ
VVLNKVFSLFPDDYETLWKEKLAFFYYKNTDHIIPITYEDFLPFSAVGIFKSNLGDMENLQGKDLDDAGLERVMHELQESIQILFRQFDERGFYLHPPEKSAHQLEFEKALGQPTIDMFDAYAALQQLR